LGKTSCRSAESVRFVGMFISAAPSCITDNSLVLRPNPAFLRIPYIAAVLRTRNLNDIASKTAQPLITGTQVLDQRVPMPPMQEQDAIVLFLESETGECDQLMAEAKQSITLLRERRSAVISAAVTGQFDVRDLTNTAIRSVQSASMPA